MATHNRIDYTNLNVEDIAATIEDIHKGRDAEAAQILGTLDPRRTTPTNYNLEGIAHQTAKAVTAHDPTPVRLMSDHQYNAHVEAGQAALRQAINDHFHRS